MPIHRSASSDAKTSPSSGSLYFASVTVNEACRSTKTSRLLARRLSDSSRVSHDRAVEASKDGMSDSDGMEALLRTSSVASDDARDEKPNIGSGDETPRECKVSELDEDDVPTFSSLQVPHILYIINIISHLSPQHNI